LVNRPFSVYLDLVRFVAALLVYLWHSNQRFLSTALLPASDYGHSSVIVFFVLSGFVIAFITDTREATPSEYFASRIARVFSVAVPAIALTLALDSVGRLLYPAIYDYPFDQFVVRVLGSLLMLNEVWLISITSFSNVPYWSLCYEWWYYVTFAMVTFLPGRRGLVAAAVTMLVIGPKVILLAPVWWAGVLLYRWRWLLGLSVPTSWALAAISFLGIVIFHRLDMMSLAESWLRTWIGVDLVHSLTFSKRVLADYMLGILVFMNFAGVRNIVAAKGKWLLAVAAPVRFLANFTFTLYLMHQPFFLFWAAWVRGDPDTPWYWASVTALTMGSVVIVGFVTESQRFTLRARLLALLGRLKPDNVAAAGSAAR
jgi:peptidoglycan/LPS O-acetylase OafA/YrhL